MKRYSLFAIVALLSAGLDLLTKGMVEARFKPFDLHPVIDGFFNLTYLKNPGAAFGIFADSGEYRVAFFIVVTLIAMAFILWFLGKYGDESPLFPLSLGLIFGGAVGNLVDRVRYGAVVDFIDIYWNDYHWPAFNVADSTITVGIILIFLVELLRSRIEEG